MALWLKVLHVVGVVFWIGGVVAVAAVGMAAARSSAATAGASLARTANRHVATPGLVLAWLGGLALLAMGWGAYAKMPWVHIKLTLGLVAAGLSGVLAARLRKLEAGEAVSAGSLRVLAGLIAAMALANVVLAFAGPGWFAR
ncbi:MAG: CopD family protein [Myxococcota bacterium]